MAKLTFHDKKAMFDVSVEKGKALWLDKILPTISVKAEENLGLFSFLKADFEKQFEDFELFWYSKPMNKLRENGLLVL